MRTIVVAAVAIVTVFTISACDKIGIGPTGTCVDDTPWGGCTVNAKDFVCNSSGSDQKKPFFKEDGTAGLARCKSLGFNLPSDPAQRQKAQDDLKAGNMVRLTKPR